MEAITVKELLAAVHGELLQGDETAQILGVNTDSRTVKAGEVFVPLVGERFDGHDYIEKALSAGAEGCLCARVPETLLPGKFYIKVPDTLLALKDLAAWYRAQFSIPFVQVTGSVGKTTTIGKLASQLKKEGNRVLLSAADTFRAAAADQLTVCFTADGKLVTGNRLMMPVMLPDVLVGVTKRDGS